MVSSRCAKVAAGQRASRQHHQNHVVLLNFAKFQLPSHDSSSHDSVNVSAVILMQACVSSLWHSIALSRQTSAGTVGCREEDFSEDFAGQVLSFDRDGADMYAEIAASRRTTGKPISQFDAMIVAMARSRGATLATRNVRDFDDCGVEVVNPWAPHGEIAMAKSARLTVQQWGNSLAVRIPAGGRVSGALKHSTVRHSLRGSSFPHARPAATRASRS